MVQSAGVLFTNGSLVLAGVQEKNGKKIISGFGGKAKEGETPAQTAAREVLEEIFDICPDPEQIAKVESLLLTRPYVPAKGESGWSFFICDFVCLSQIYESTSFWSQLSDPIYRRKSVEKNTYQLLFHLLFNRHPGRRSEILQFVLLPAEETPIGSEFLADLIEWKKTNSISM